MIVLDYAAEELTRDRSWATVPGAPPGHHEKILTQSPERMFVTRLMKVDAGCASTEVFVHDFYRTDEGCVTFEVRYRL